jgi:hypothetical protein
MTGAAGHHGAEGGVGGKQGTKQNTEAHILQTKQIDSISQRLRITSITYIYIYIYIKIYM